MGTRYIDALKRFINKNIRHLILRVRNLIYFRKLLGMDIHPTALISLKAKLDKTNPRGIHIGAYTHVAFGATVLTHDMCRSLHTDTRIGENCFIGANAIILPGVTIGNHCIIGAGAVVTGNIPSNTIAVGNPAKIIRSNINTREFGILQS